jgi:GcrA cell cycle regulator
MVTPVIIDDLRRTFRHTDDSDRILSQLFNEGRSYEEMGKRLGLSRDAIKSRLSRLGLTQKSTSPWNETTLTLLASMNAIGESFSRIAKEISRVCGMVVTRNACIGKARRMNLPQREVKPPKLPREPMPFRPPQPIAQPKPKPEPIPLITNPVTIFQLNHKTCRWPLGGFYDPPDLFCGAPPLNGVSYCASHAARAFTPSHR